MKIKKLCALLILISVSGLFAAQPCGLSCKSVRKCDKKNDVRSPQFNIFVNALYWQAREEGLDYAIKNNNGAVFINNNGKVERAEFDWNAGFRVGVGYCGAECPMGFNAYYTRYTTRGCDKVTATFPAVLFPTWSNPGTSIVTEQEARAKIDLSLNMFDAQLNTVFSPNDCVSIMPVLGLRYAKINQCFSINANGGQTFSPFAFVLDDAITMQNNFWGTGPKVGINTTWGAWHGLSIFGSMDVALLYGKFDITQKETIEFSNNVPSTTYLDIKCNRFHITRPNVGLVLGFQWDSGYKYNKQYSMCFSAGLEHQYFFGQNQLMRFSDDVNPGVNTSVQGDLSTQGLTIALSLSF